MIEVKTEKEKQKLEETTMHKIEENEVRNIV